MLKALTSDQRAAVARGLARMNPKAKPVHVDKVVWGCSRSVVEQNVQAGYWPDWMLQTKMPNEARQWADMRLNLQYAESAQRDPNKRGR